MFISERVNCSDQISRGRPGGAVQKEDAAVAAANGFHCERHTKTVNTGDYLSAASMKGTSGGLSTTAERYWEGTTLYTYTTLRGKGFSCTGREIDLIYARRTGAELPIKSLPIIVHPPPLLRRPPSPSRTGAYLEAGTYSVSAFPFVQVPIGFPAFEKEN